MLVDFDLSFLRKSVLSVLYNTVNQKFFVQDFFVFLIFMVFNFSCYTRT